nr:hypothetical protein [Dyadobacter fermentans]
MFVSDIVRNSAKQWISLSLLGLMLVKVWVIPLLYLDFEIRREYIVANLCENKNRPQMHCDGKCYLAKRIAALDEQEKRQAEKTYMSRLIDQVMDQRAVFSFAQQPVVVELLPQAVFSVVPCFTPRIAVDDIFHPPLV